MYVTEISWVQTFKVEVNFVDTYISVEKNYRSDKKLCEVLVRVSLIFSRQI